MTVHTLAEVVRGLRPVGRARFGRFAADRLLRGVEVDAGSLAPYLHFRPGRYTRNLVYRDRHFELMVLCWTAGSRTAVHDHAGQECFVQVLEGAFEQEEFQLLRGG